MFRHAVALCVGMILTIMAFLHAQNHGPAEELKKSRARWASHKLSNYRYTLRVECSCPDFLTKPVVIEVHAGDTTAINPTGQKRFVFFKKYSTVPKLFGIVQQALAEKADEVAIEYDSRFGYPTTIKIDHKRDVRDDDEQFIITSFEVVSDE